MKKGRSILRFKQFGVIFKRRIRTLEHGPERISDIVNEPTIIIPVGIHLPVVGTGKTAAESRIVHGKGFTARETVRTGFQDRHRIERLGVLRVLPFIEGDGPRRIFRPPAFAFGNDAIVAIDILLGVVLEEVVGPLAVVARQIEAGAVARARSLVNARKPDTDNVVLLIGRRVSVAPVPRLVHSRRDDFTAVPAAENDHRTLGGGAVENTGDRIVDINPLERLFENGIGNRIGALLAVLGRHDERIPARRQIERAAGPDRSGRVVGKFDFGDLHAAHVGDTAKNELHGNGAGIVVAPVIGNDRRSDLGLQPETDRGPFTQPGVHHVRCRRVVFVTTGQKQTQQARQNIRDDFLHRVG